MLGSGENGGGVVLKAGVSAKAGRSVGSKVERGRL